MGMKLDHRSLSCTSGINTLMWGAARRDQAIPSPVITRPPAITAS